MPTHGKQMNRNYLKITVVLLVASFLVVLGMRNASLDHKLGPRQRPRAIVENVMKAPIGVCCELHVDADACPLIALTAVVVHRTFFTPAIGYTSALTQLFIPSRASPALPSLS